MFAAMAAWQAGLLVLGAAGVAAWLFLIKVRPPKVSVPSLLLWRRVLDQSRTLSWWDRVRRAVSLAATVLLAVALALAVARPGPRVSASSRGRLLIVLDSSWSMAARGAGATTRWAQAVAQAKALAQSTAGDEVAIATTANGLVEGPTADTALIETALDRLAPAGGEGTAWPRIGGADEVHFFTDLAVPRALDSGVIVHSVFTPAPNVAITAFAAAPPTLAGQPGEVYLEIGNFAPESQDVHVTLSRGTAIVLDRPVTMAAGETVRQVVPLDAAGDPRLRARVSAPGNALDVDDEATAWLRSAEPLAVTIVSPDPGALALLLQRDPAVRLTLRTPATYQPERTDVVIFDRWLPAAAPAVPALIIAPPASSWLGGLGDEERTPRWTGTGLHPVVAGVDPLSLDVKRARAIAGRLTTVAASERGTPLVAVSDQSTARFVVLSFALADSNLAYSPAFPVLVGNALEWLARPALGASGRPGPLALPASTTRVLNGDGESVPLALRPDAVIWKWKCRTPSGDPSGFLNWC
jgi:hypothetical protein